MWCVCVRVCEGGGGGGRNQATIANLKSALEA